MSYALESGITDPSGQSQVILGDSPNLDAFHRLRVSLPYTLFDQTFEYGLGSLFWSSAVVGGGSGFAHHGDSSNIILTAGTGATDSVIRQTLSYWRYRPGKSQLALMTFAFGAAVANVRRRVGYFDAANGIYLEQNGTTDLALVTRSSTTGSIEEERVVQADWNLDKLDGTGPSRLTLAPALGQILVIDLQWLGYGRVRVGFDIQGKTRYVHEFYNANNQTMPYMSTASLPVRFEITNLAGQAESHTFRQGCCSVISEDGEQELFGVFFSANTGATKHAVTTRRALISIRPKLVTGTSSKVNRSPILAEAFSMLTATNDSLWEVVYNPTFTDTPTWTSAGAQSDVEYSIHTDGAAGAFTGGLVVTSGYVAAGQGVTAESVVQAPLLNKLPLTLDMNGANPIAISIVATSMAGTSNIAAGINWKEIR